ncbi:hypothetical protein ACJX0J_014063, partial [Zea mays]
RVRVVLGVQHDGRGGGRQLPRHGGARRPQRAAAGRLRPHVQRGGAERVQQRLRRRADDERVLVPDGVRRPDGAERVPVHGRGGALPLRPDPGRRPRGQLHRRAGRRRGPDPRGA